MNVTNRLKYYTFPSYVVEDKGKKQSSGLIYWKKMKEKIIDGKNDMRQIEKLKCQREKQNSTKKTEERTDQLLVGKLTKEHIAERTALLL